MRVLTIFVLFLCLLEAGAIRAQTRSSSPALPPLQEQSVPEIGGEEQDRSAVSMQKRQQLERNKQRYQEIKRDADKLLQLATGLKLSVDKSDENQLSLDVIKKAGEIEKLAKAVKEKMKAN